MVNGQTCCTLFASRFIFLFYIWLETAFNFLARQQIYSSVVVLDFCLFFLPERLFVIWTFNKPMPAGYLLSQAGNNLNSSWSISFVYKSALLCWLTGWLTVGMSIYWFIFPFILCLFGYFKQQNQITDTKILFNISMIMMMTMRMTMMIMMVMLVVMVSEMCY